MSGESGEHDDYLQVFMTHEVVIEEFKLMLERHGWELSAMPRFDESDDDYVKTHIVVPKNLDVLMKNRTVGIPTPKAGDSHE